MAELPDYLQPRYKKSTRRLNRDKETSPISCDLSSNDAGSMILPKNEGQPSPDSVKSRGTSADCSGTPPYPLDSDGLTPDSVDSTELAWKAEVSETDKAFSGTRKSDVEMNSLIIVAASSQDDNHNHPSVSPVKNSSGNDTAHEPSAKKMQDPPISPVIDTRKVSPLKLFLKKPVRLSCASGSSNPATEDGYSVKRISPLKLVIKRPPLRSPEVPAEPISKPPESPVAPHYEKVSKWISSDLHLPGESAISSGGECEQMPTRGIKRKHPDSRDSSFSPVTSKQREPRDNRALNQSFGSSSGDDVPLLSVIGRRLQSALSNPIPRAAVSSDGSGSDESGPQGSSQRSSNNNRRSPTNGLDSEDEYQGYETYNIPRSRTPCSEYASSPRYRPSDGSPIYYQSERVSSGSPGSHNASEPAEQLMDDVFVAPRPVDVFMDNNTTNNEMPFASPERVIKSEGSDSYIDVVGSGPRVEIPVNEQITMSGNVTVANYDEQRIYDIQRELSRSPETAEEAVHQMIMPAPEEEHASLDGQIVSDYMESNDEPAERQVPLEASVPVDAPPVSPVKSRSPSPVVCPSMIATESIPAESQMTFANGAIAEIHSPSNVIVNVSKDSSITEKVAASGSLPMETKETAFSLLSTEMNAESFAKFYASPESHDSAKVADEAASMDSSAKEGVTSDSSLPVEKEEATIGSVSSTKKAESPAKSQTSPKSPEPAKVSDEAPTMDFAISPEEEVKRPRRSSRAVSVVKKASVEPPPKKEKKSKKKPASPKKKKQKKTETVAPVAPVAPQQPLVFYEEEPEHPAFIPYSLDPNVLRVALEQAIRAANAPQWNQRSRHIPRVPSPRRNRRQMDFACYRPMDDFTYWMQNPIPPPLPPAPAAQDQVEVKLEEPESKPRYRPPPDERCQLRTWDPDSTEPFSHVDLMLLRWEEADREAAEVEAKKEAARQAREAKKALKAGNSKSTKPPKPKESPDLPPEYQVGATTNAANDAGFRPTQAESYPSREFDPDEPLFGYICPDDPTKTVIIKEEEDDDHYMHILDWSVPTIPPGTPAPIYEWPFRARVGDYLEFEFESVFELFRQDPVNAELFRAYEEKRRVAAIAAAAAAQQQQEMEEMFRMKPSRAQSAPAVMGIDQSMINDITEHVHHIPDTLLGAFYKESKIAMEHLLAKYEQKMAARREPAKEG